MAFTQRLEGLGDPRSYTPPTPGVRLGSPGSSPLSVDLSPIGARGPSLPGVPVPRPRSEALRGLDLLKEGPCRALVSIQDGHLRSRAPGTAVSHGVFIYFLTENPSHTVFSRTEKCDFTLQVQSLERMERSNRDSTLVPSALPSSPLPAPPA